MGVLVIFRSTGRWFLRMVAVLVPLSLAFSMLLMHREVQDGMGRLLARWLSKEWGTRVEIDGFYLGPTGRMRVERISIYDQTNRILFEMNRFYAYIDPIRTGLNRITIPEVSVGNFTLNALHDPKARNFNFQFLLDVFQTESTPSAGIALPNIRIRNFRLHQAHIRYHDFRRPSADTTRFDPYHIELKQCRWHLSEISYSDRILIASLNQFRFDATGGWRVDSLQAKLKADSTGIQIDSWKLMAPGTFLAGQFSIFRIVPDSISVQIPSAESNSVQKPSAESNSVQKPSTAYRLSIQEGLIDPRFMAYFLGASAPSQPLVLRGRYDYADGRLHGDGVRLAFGSSLFAEGELRLSELGKSKGPVFSVRVDQGQWNRQSWNSAFPRIPLPAVLDSLQYLGFQASFEGQTEQFHVRGAFSDGKGKANADLAVHLAGPKSTYVGHLGMSAFHLGRWLGDQHVGQLDMDVDLQATGDRADNLNARLKGALHRLDYHGYSLGPIEIHGDYALGTFQGRIESDDQNACFTFQGLVDARQEVPLYDFVANVDQLDLKAIGMSDEDWICAGKVKLSGSGQKPDDLQGQLTGTDLVLNHSGDLLNLDFVSLDMKQERSPNGPLLMAQCNTPFGTAVVRGDGNLSLLSSAIRSAIGLKLSENEHRQLEGADSTARFTLDVDLDRAEQLTDYFISGQISLDRLLFFARLNPRDGNFDFSADASDVRSGAVRSDRISLLGKRQGTHLEADVFAGSIDIGQQRLVQNLRWLNTLEGDTLRYALEGLGTEENQRAMVNGWSVADTNGVHVYIDSSKLFVFEQNWFLKQRDPFVYHNGRFSLGDFTLGSDSMAVVCRGVLGPQEQDEAVLSVVGVPLAPLVPFLLPSEYNMEGKMQLNVRAHSVLQRPELTGTLIIPELRYNGQLLGDLRAQSVVDPDSRVMQLKADVQRPIGLDTSLSTEMQKPRQLLTVDGSFSRRAGQDSLELDLILSDLPAWVLNPLLQPVFDSLDGGLSGDLRLFINGPKTELTGWADLSQNRIHVDFLDQSFRLGRRITLLPDRIRFDSVTVSDGLNGSGWVTGSLMHKNLDRFTIDLKVDARNMQVINTPPSYREAFFGTGRATGSARITGDFNLVDIDVVATTERGTRIELPLDGEGSRSANEFIDFVSATRDEAGEVEEMAFHPEGVAFRMNLNMNRDAEFSVLFDRAAGDILKGNGEGQMVISYRPDGELLMDGSYTVHSGDYMFTLANLPGKKFKLEQGGTITWSGDPYDAQLDLSAVYRQRCDVDRLLDPSQLQNEARKQITVDTYLKLKGSLLKPDVGFQLKLPGNIEDNATDPVAARIRSINQNEQELNNQVLALLIAGQFFPADNAALTGLLGSTGANSLTEVLSNQLNNMLSQLIDNVSLGISYRNRSNLINTSASGRQGDLAVAGNVSLFNDRLLIDGKLGSNTVQTSNSTTLAGEIMMEYLLTRDGAVRMKAFNRLDDRILNNADSNYRYGVGMSITENYDTLPDLWVKVKNRFRKAKQGNKTTE